MFWRKWLTVLVCGAALAGCIPTQQQLAMERDLEEMKRRLAEIERGTAALRQNQQSGQVQDRLNSLALSQADQQATFDALRVEVQSINGRFEDVRREQAGLKEELSLIKEDLALKITALEDRQTRLEAALAARPTAAAPESAESQYERGVELIRKGEFASGREKLEQFLNRNPQASLAVNAMYWIGEAYYGEKKYENAILQFQDVIQKYSDHPKVAAALLKQGFAFDAIKDRKNARTVLQRLADTFPLSDEAKKARERLAEWDKKKT